jgi:hypothetical protein
VKRAANDPEDIDSTRAQAFLGKVLQNFKNVDELFQKAGLFRLARAVHGLDELFIRQMSQRFPRAHGRLLYEYLQKVEELGPLQPEQAQKLRDQVLYLVSELSQRGKIDPKYGAIPVHKEGK